MALVHIVTFLMCSTSAAWHNLRLEHFDLKFAPLFSQTMRQVALQDGSEGQTGLHWKAGHRSEQLSCSTVWTLNPTCKPTKKAVSVRHLHCICTTSHFSIAPMPLHSKH